MVRVFIDLSSNIALIVAKDNYIAYYEDLDYTVNVLDVLYSKLQNVPVDEAIVVMHGVVSEKNEICDLEFNGLQVRESIRDFDAFKHLFGALTVPKVFFYEFAGYYAMQATGRMLFVDQDDSQYQLLVFNEGFVQSQTVTYSNLQQCVRTLRNKYSIEEVVDVKNLVVPKLVHYFANYQEVPEDLQPRLSLFAFTLTNASEPYIIRKVNAIFNQAEQTQPVQQQPQQSAEKPAGQSAEQSVQQLEKSAEQPAKKKGFFSFGKKKKKGVPTLLALFISALCLGSTGVAYGGTAMYNKVLATDIENMNTLNSQYLSESSELAAYQRVKNQVEGTVSSESTPIEILCNLDYEGGSDFVIESSEDSVDVRGTFHSKNAAKVFVSKAKKLYSVSDSKVSKAKKSKYFAAISISIV